MMGQAQPDKNLLKWPLVQQFFTRAPLNTTYPSAQELFDARLINAYGEKIPNSKDEYWVVKRPGVGALAWGPNTGVPGGSYQYTNPMTGATTILQIVGGSLYANSVLVTGFSVVAGAPCYFETINSNPVTIVILMGEFQGSAGRGFIYTPGTTTAVTITDTTFTGINRVPGLAFLNDWFYVMDVTGTIWNTQNQSSVVTWNALNTIQANNYGDAGVCLARQLTYIIAMKQWTTNIFYDAGAQINGQGSPLGEVPDSTIPYGCMHAYTVAKIDETLLWVTTNQNVQPQVCLLQNLNPSIVSTPSVERVLKNFAMIAGAEPPPLNAYGAGIYSWGIKIAGHKLYGLTIPVMNITMVFDLDQALWYLWTDQNGNFWPYAYAYVQSSELYESDSRASIPPAYRYGRLVPSRRDGHVSDR